HFGCDDEAGIVVPKLLEHGPEPLLERKERRTAALACTNKQQGLRDRNVRLTQHTLKVSIQTPFLPTKSARFRRNRADLALYNPSMRKRFADRQLCAVYLTKATGRLQPKNRVSRKTLPNPPIPPVSTLASG